MKKFLTLLLMVVMLVPCVACGAPKDEEGVINIAVYDGGYGVDWLNDIAANYTKETGIVVKVNAKKGQAGAINIGEEVFSGESIADLIVSKDMMFDKIYQGTYTNNGKTYDNLLEDLTDLYDTKIPGEEVTLKEKIFSDFRDCFLVEGKYYAVPWASGMIGLLRNLTVWEQYNWKVPNTTDEMFAIADEMKNSATKEGFQAPFIYAEDDEYWSMFSHVWIAQYMGSKNMKKFYDGYSAVYDEEEFAPRYQMDMFEDEAFSSTLRILERLLKDENKYMHELSKQTNFTNMQSSFLRGKAVMTPNGDWIEREMKSNYKTVNIEFMKTPLNSAVADRCSFKNAENRDAILSSVVTYVDSHKTGYEGKPEGVTDKDIDIIRDSRSIEYTVGHEHYMAIPSYANEKEKAKEFLLYVASDKGIKQYVESSMGCIPPFNYDYSAMEGNFSEFRKKTSARIAESNLLFASKKNRLFSIGGVNMYWSNNASKDKVIPSLSASNKDDYRSATQIMADELSYLSVAGRWQGILSKAGINA